MRRLAILGLGVLWIPILAVAQVPSAEEAFQQGNKAYQEADYQKAVHAYQSILDMGLTAPEVEFNLGSAFLKGGSLGRAILHYRRALKMDSGYENAQKNISFTRQRTRDVQESPVGSGSWLSQFGLTLNKAAWILFGSVCLLSLFGAIRIVFMPNHLAGTILSGVFAGLVLLSLMGFLYQVSSIQGVQEGVVLAEEVEVRAGPGQEFTVHFRLHEGSEVELIRDSGGWQEIRISDELQGWIPVSSVAAI